MSKPLDPIIKTVKVPMNIAFIKYWGKSDAKEMLPLNDSISVNLNDLFAETKIELKFNELSSDIVIVNNKKMTCNEGTRYYTVFTEFRRIIGTKYEQLFSIHVESKTSFPVKAGLASSAAGFAALAYGLGQVSNLKDHEIARLARLGSGSACRSLYPGFVHWDSTKKEYTDDFVISLPINSEFLSQLLAFVFLFNKNEKEIGSSEGMLRTVQTSELLQHRTTNIVPEHVIKMKCAVVSGDFDLFGEITMKESNNLHAVCMDTYPPLFYLNESSHQLINVIHKLNSESENGLKAAYTFDAGPNGIVMLSEKNAENLIEKLQLSRIAKFQFISAESTFKTLNSNLQQVLGTKDLTESSLPEIEVLITRVGNGPSVL